MTGLHLALVLSLITVLVRQAAPQAPPDATSWPIPGVLVPGVEGVTAPRVIKEVKPNYTAEAMRARIQGVAVLECVVETDGRVGPVRIVRSLDAVHGLDEEAIRTLRQWRFVPAMKDGAPVRVVVKVEISFTIRDRPRLAHADPRMAGLVLRHERSIHVAAGGLVRGFRRDVHARGARGLSRRLVDPEGDERERARDPAGRRCAWPSSDHDCAAQPRAVRPGHPAPGSPAERVSRRRGADAGRADAQRADGPVRPGAVVRKTLALARDGGADHQPAGSSRGDRGAHARGARRHADVVLTTTAGGQRFKSSARSCMPRIPPTPTSRRRSAAPASSSAPC